jgi:hypothetical protein
MKKIIIYILIALFTPIITFGAIELIDQIAPKAGGFQGMVDDDQVIDTATTAGNILVSGGSYMDSVAMSNDCAIASNGAITCDHDALDNFLATEHVDWAGASAGTIHTDNYIEGHGNGANCASGNSPLGVDASGAVESCFDVWTEAENTAAGYISATLTEEEVEDYVGGMLGGTETLITVDYQDGSNDIDFVVDNNLHNYSWANVVDADITDDLTINNTTSITTTGDLTAASSTFSGNLDVTGIGSFGPLNTSGAVIFNEAGADVDFRVEGVGNANLIFADASYPCVGIGGTCWSPLMLRVVGSARITSNLIADGYISGAVNNTSSFMLTDTGATGRIVLFVDDSDDFWIGPTGGPVGTTTNIRFNPGSTTKMLLTEAGNLGIGDDTPAALLTVGDGDLFQVNSSGDITAASSTLSGNADVVGNFTAGTIQADDGWTGTCLAASSTIVVGGIITGCE